MYLRKLVREIIIAEQFVPPTPVGVVPKGEWTLLTPGSPEFNDVRDNLWELIEQTYSYMGGHVKLSGPESLGRYSFWVVQDIDEDPDIDVAMFGKPEFGTKVGGAANDGSSAAASEYKTKSAELRKGGSVAGVGNWWGEVSGKPAYAMISRGAPAIEDEAQVAALLAGDDYVWHGAHPDPDAPGIFQTVNGWYTKTFNGQPKTKIILGNPAV